MMKKAWELLGQLSFANHEVEPGINVLSLPVFPLGRLAGLTWPILRMGLHRSLRLMGPHRPVLWCSFPTPMLGRIIQEIQPKLIIYDCTSAIVADPYVVQDVIAAEKSLLQVADLVFSASRNLWERHSRTHPRCFWIPNGVDFGRFAQAKRPAQRLWPGPVVGYVGTLHVWLDTQLIYAVASQHPEWRFVFVGPRRLRAETDRLERLTNVEFVGPEPHEAIPDLLMQFDVAWIPYRLTEFTQSVFPTKMMEYLAAGRPVVSTDLPEVRPFSPPVRIGTTTDEIGRHLEGAVQERTDDRGQLLAKTFDWQVQMDQIHRHLDQVLTETRTTS